MIYDILETLYLNGLNIMKIFITLFLVVFLLSCANQPKLVTEAKGRWMLPESPIELDAAQLQDKFDIARENCITAVEEANIPKPKCVSRKAIQQCRFSITTSSNFCGVPQVNKLCDIDSVGAYNKARSNVIKNCMTVAGWVWRDRGDAYQPLQNVIDSIPELAAWQKNDPKKWGLVSSIDMELASLPEYQNIPTRDRLLVVVEKVKQASL